MTPTIRILLNVEGESPCSGELEVTQLTPNRFRLEEGPLLMFDGGLHDIIEADLQNDGSYSFRRIVETSPWQKFDFVLSKERAESNAFKERLFRTVEYLGGSWETMFGGLVCLYLPPGIHFNLQEQTASTAERLRLEPKNADDAGSLCYGEQRLLSFDLSRGASHKQE